MPEVVGFTRPTLQTIIDRIVTDLNTRLPGTDARLRRATLNVIARVLAGAAHLLYGFISFVAQQIIVDTAKVEFLERHASIWGVNRKVAVAATGTATFTGVNGTDIPAATKVGRVDGDEFVTVALVTIAAGTAVASMKASVVGVNGNTDTGVLLTLLAPITGIDSTATIDSPGLSGGANTELDDPYRVRVLDRIQEPPHGGADFDYSKWALEVAGVTRAWVGALELGPGAVTVRFVRDNETGSIIPDAGEVTTVQTYIDARRPVTAKVTVVAPVAVALNFTITITPDTAAIRTAIQTELEDLLTRDAAPGTTIFISRINEAVSTGAGEFDHTVTVMSPEKRH